MERVTRIELAFSAWEADVLPLNYTRSAAHRIRAMTRRRQATKRPRSRRPGRNAEVRADVFERPWCECEVLGLAEVGRALRAAPQRLTEEFRRAGSRQRLGLRHDRTVLEQSGFVDREVREELHPVGVVVVHRQG